MKQLLFTILSNALGISLTIGQSMPLEVISSSGGQETNEITLQWTLGESMVFYLEDVGESSVSEGFHQLFQIDRDLKEEAQVRANIFPNPSENLFNIQVDNPGAIDYVISNSIGQIIQSGQFEKEFELSMRDYAAGVYFMTLYTEARFDRSFSLVKI